MVAELVGDLVELVVRRAHLIEIQRFLVAVSDKFVIRISLDNGAEASHRLLHHWSRFAHVTLGELLHEHL